MTNDATSVYCTVCWTNPTLIFSSKTADSAVSVYLWQGSYSRRRNTNSGNDVQYSGSSWPTGYGGQNLPKPRPFPTWFFPQCSESVTLGYGSADPDHCFSVISRCQKTLFFLLISIPVVLTVWYKYLHQSSEIKVTVLLRSHKTVGKSTFF